MQMPPLRRYVLAVLIDKFRKQYPCGKSRMSKEIVDVYAKFLKYDLQWKWMPYWGGENLQEGHKYDV